MRADEQRESLEADLWMGRQVCQGRKSNRLENRIDKAVMVLTPWCDQAGVWKFLGFGQICRMIFCGLNSVIYSLFLIPLGYLVFLTLRM